MKIECGLTVSSKPLDSGGLRCDPGVVGKDVRWKETEVGRVDRIVSPRKKIDKICERSEDVDLSSGDTPVEKV